MDRGEFLYSLGKLLVYAQEQGIKVIAFTVYRSPEDQLKEYNAGRSQVKVGKHQKWLAIDLAIWEDMDEDGNVDKDEIRWNNDPRYSILGNYWKSIGGIWGGTWISLKDIYHFEG